MIVQPVVEPMDRFTALIVAQVFISSARVSVYTEPLDTWVLRLESVSRGDGGSYDCHLNNNITTGPVKLSVLLRVRGQL